MWFNIHTYNHLITLPFLGSTNFVWYADFEPTVIQEKGGYIEIYIYLKEKSILPQKKTNLKIYDRTTPPPPETTPATASLVTVPLPNLEDEANNAIKGSRGGSGSGRRRGNKNFRRIGVNARFSANFRPTPKSFDRQFNILH